MAAVLMERDGGLARVTLNRPDVANGIDLEMANDLLALAVELKADPQVRCVLLTGAGGRFCAGGDVRSFAASDDIGALLGEITGALHAAISTLAALDAPIVTAVQGSVAGAGIGLVCASDIVVSARSCKFVMAYTGIGFTPDGSTTWFLPRIVGHRRAVEMALANTVLGADEAAAIGLVTRVVDDESLTTEAEGLARRLATGPTRAFGATKRLLRDSHGRDLEGQMRAETDAIIAAAQTVDGIEGVAAFAAKRSAIFQGR